MTYYYALWIPQCEKGIPVIIKESLSKKKYQDKVELPPFEIEGTIVPVSYQIRLIISFGNAQSRELILECTEKSEDGFLVYKIELEEDVDSVLSDSLQTGMKKTIYHYVKGFFHEHQYHHASDDSLLKAYYSSDEIDLSENVQKYAVVSNYLTAYELKYSGYVDESEDTISQVIGQIEERKRLSKNVKLLRASIFNNMKVLDGESKYCNYLMSACSDVIPQDNIQRLKQLIEQLRNLNLRMSSIDSYLSSEVSTRQAETGIRWGIASVVVAIVIFGYQYLSDSTKGMHEDLQLLRKEQNSTNEELKQRLDKANDKQDSLVHQIDKVEQKVDSLNSKKDRQKH
jgi:Sec-independent protein translocase protein TatA